MDEKLFDLMTKLYGEFQEIKNTMATKEDIEGVKKDIVGVKQDIVRLENKVMDKIDALFDAREVQIDRETEVVTNLKQVQNKVDKLELRIVRSHFREG